MFPFFCIGHPPCNNIRTEQRQSHSDISHGQTNCANSIASSTVGSVCAAVNWLFGVCVLVCFFFFFFCFFLPYFSLSPRTNNMLEVDDFIWNVGSAAQRVELIARLNAIWKRSKCNSNWSLHRPADENQRWETQTPLENAPPPPLNPRPSSRVTFIGLFQLGFETQFRTYRRFEGSKFSEEGAIPFNASIYFNFFFLRLFFFPLLSSVFQVDGFQLGYLVVFRLLQWMLMAESKKKNTQQKLHSLFWNDGRLTAEIGLI